MDLITLLRDLDIEDLRDQILQPSTYIDDLEKIQLNADRLRLMCRQAIKYKKQEQINTATKELANNT